MNHVMKKTNRDLIRRGLSCTALAIGLFAPSVALAQDKPAETAPTLVNSDNQTITSGSLAAATPEGGDDAIMVTGSRIRRADTQTAEPVTVLDVQEMNDRGFVSAADLLNQSTSMTPNYNQAAGNGTSAGNGQQFPELFGLGAGRTLTLVNGRRMVTTSSGLGDSQVDANIIPVGLLKRVEIVQGSGAAVYGSDAIAGVVNYILRDDFKGFQVDAQNGISERGDYPTRSFRGTWGMDFAGGRGNIAIDTEYSSTPSLLMSARAASALSRMTTSNPANTSSTDGIPATRNVTDVRFWEFNDNGVVFTRAAPVTAFLAKLNGSALQFAPDGQSLGSYNPGTTLTVPFATGGQGYLYSNLAGLRTGVQRVSSSAVAHYDITSSMKISTELTFAHTRGQELPQGFSATILNSAASGFGPIAFTKSNPYLSATDIATLSAANPAFATGGTLYLSKYFEDLLQSNYTITTTNTYRGLVALDDDFHIGKRDFYWNISGSYGRVEGNTSGWGVYNAHFNNAINSAVNASGQIVCAINADAITTNDDPACAPINPFGNGNVSAAARNYVSVRIGSAYVNQEADLLATLGGSLFTLPGGDLGFSTAFEHRYESADFTPAYANQLGLVAAGDTTAPTSGSYHTDEISGELLAPLVGGDFTLPLIRKLELSSAYRYVKNSLAGGENVWNVGARWSPVDGVTFRGARSRNFRAPTLTQLLAPSSKSLIAIGQDPCDADHIASGVNPAVRKANCQAVFAAHPGYGALATFQDPAENFASTTVTTGGNPNLKNEVSFTWSYGIVLQPRFIPGLTIVADRELINMKQGLTAFAPMDFAAACFDTVGMPAQYCNAFTRDASGTIVTGQTTTVNAGITKYHGEVYNVNYQVPLAALFPHRNLGSLELAVEATHTSLLETAVVGSTFTRTDGTAAQPSWVGRFDLRYAKGPFRFTYELYYMNRTKSSFDATIETTPNPYLAANLEHSISAQYAVGHGLTLRGGITNLTDKMPSFPSLSYGDIIGRRFFVGATAKF